MCQNINIFGSYENDGYKFAVARFTKEFNCLEFVDKDIWGFTITPQNVQGFRTLAEAESVVRDWHRGRFASCMVTSFPRSYAQMTA